MLSHSIRWQKSRENILPNVFYEFIFRGTKICSLVLRQKQVEDKSSVTRRIPLVRIVW